MKKLCVAVLSLLICGIACAEESRTIKATVGDEFVIALDAIHSTGYQWQLATPLDGNLLKAETTEYIPGPSDRVGVKGQEEWKFKALNSGETRVSFKYVRPWEKDVKPAQEKSLQIVITAAPQITGFDYLKLSKRQRGAAVASYIASVKQEGIRIKNRPVFYCQKLDAFYEKNPNHKKEPLYTLLKSFIIMEYDWDQKGVDKEKLAREWLGEDVYQANRQRLGR